jgi:hypothetical protein
MNFYIMFLSNLRQRVGETIITIESPSDESEYYYNWTHPYDYLLNMSSSIFLSR